MRSLDHHPTDDSTAAAAPRRQSDGVRRLETARLLSRARASQDTARAAYENEVVQINMPVAYDVARRYRGRGIPDDDLVQVAYLGLVKAVRGFDPRLGDDFLSFAVPTLRGEIQRYFRDAGGTVRPPRSVQETQSKVTAAEAELTQQLGRQPRPQEIADHLGVDLGLVVDSMSASGLFHVTSLDAPLSAELDDTIAQRLGAHDPAFATAEARLALRPLVRDLQPRERTIIALRFFANRTQTQIGDELGISQEQVSRLLSGILARLRRSLVDAA